MLMNGQKVNHLIIGGETFDKSFDGSIKVRTIKDSLLGVISKSGEIEAESIGVGRGYIPKGRVITLIARYRNAVCTTAEDIGCSGWMSINDVEFIDDNETGGVNSPFYLLSLYCCIVLLALGVLLLC